MHSWREPTWELTPIKLEKLQLYIQGNHDIFQRKNCLIFLNKQQKRWLPIKNLLCLLLTEEIPSGKLLPIKISWDSFNHK